MLTKDEVDFYHTYGYIAVENVLTEAEVMEARRVVDDFVEQSRAATQHTDIFDLEPDHTPENPRVRRLKGPVRIHPFFDKLMRSKAVLSVVADLIGLNIRYQGDKLNMKSAAFGSPVEWHQDFAFYPHTNDDLLATGIAIDDCTEENGCLMVIPRSHKGPIFDHHQEGRFVGAIDPEQCNIDFTKAIPVVVKAGGMSLHHTRLLHGSAPNKSNKPRRLLLFQYASANAWPLMGMGASSIEDFNAKIVWGEPTTLYRTTSMHLRIPLPPAERAGSIYETQTVLKKRFFGKN